MPTLHPLCTDHAVLPAGSPTVLGRARPGSRVSVRLAGAATDAVADARGVWRAVFPAMHAGGPVSLEASDAEGTVVATDILLGEVWLGSGQSNMEWTLAATKDSAADIAAANEPLLRVFTVARCQSAEGPVETVSGRWQRCTPEQAGGFSAVGYHFGRAMVAATGLPFGVIVSAWGGSAIAPWLPLETLRSRPEYAGFLAEREEGLSIQRDPQELVPHADPGIAPEAAEWMYPNFNDSDWDTLNVPGIWQDAGWRFNGAVWHRRTVELPADWRGRELELQLGIIDDCDITFVNGERIGSTGLETPNFWSTPRVYRVPARLTMGGRLVIAVRVFDQWGNGGMLGHPLLAPAGDPSAASIRLAGGWKARAELKLQMRSPGGPPLLGAALWNGMIQPLLGATLSGFLWYQGESDTGRAHLYQRLLTDLIHSWRTAFGMGELPFGIVQLAAFQPRRDTPGDDPWASLREAQRQVSRTVPGCGLAVAIDAGEADDIHPRYKRVVGERLARWALREAHGCRGPEYSGPVLAETLAEGDGVRLRFTHADGLRVRGDALRGFQLASAAGSWFWADSAEIRGDTVLVRSASVPRPAVVRYAWQANPECTLENASGLPASPFEARPA